MVNLVALLQPPQDRDRVADVRLADQHRLETALQGGVLLDVLAVLVEGGGPDRSQLPARQHRLQQVGGVHGALGGARADDRVQLVHEQDDLTLGGLDLLQHRLEALLELAAVLGAGQQGADVERDHAPVAKALGDVAGDDPLGEAFDDRRLAHPRIADQHRVVLGSPRQHLDHAPDLLVAADHRVELALLRLGCEVAAELLQRLHRVLGVRGGDAVRPADLRDSLQERVAAGQEVAQSGGLVREGEQEVLGGDVLVAEPGHLLLRPLQGTHECLRGPQVWIGIAAQARQTVDRSERPLADRGDVGAELLEDRHDQAVVLIEQREQEVRRGDLCVAVLGGEPLGGGHGLLGLDREAVWLHVQSLPGL